MDKFYIIKLFSPNGERGFVMDGPNGILIDKSGIAKATQWRTEEEAKSFIREKKLERKGVKALVMDNLSLADMPDDDAGKIIKNPTQMFYIENSEGEKLFYEPKQLGYYFSKHEVGWCAWKTDIDAQDFVSKMNFTEEVFIRNFYDNPKPQTN